MIEHKFGPKQQGERYLAGVLALTALGCLYLAFGVFEFYLPPDPRYRGSLYLLLLTAVFFLLAVAAWHWKPMQSELTVSETGVRFKSRGQAPVSTTELAWADIARIEHRLVLRPRASDLRYLVFTAGQETNKPGREYTLVANGLQDDVPDVMAAIVEAAETAGWRTIGPRVDHLAGWFDGLNWRFEKA